MENLRRSSLEPSKYMNLPITTAQYKNLIRMSSLASSVLGIVKDSLKDDEYAAQSKAMDELNEYILMFANEFGCSQMVDKEDGKNVLKDNIFEDSTMSVIGGFSECEIHNTLANKLAWRDFKKEHSAKEIGEMAKINGVYFGVALHRYEEKYWNEFESHGYDRLEVRESGINK